MWHPRHFRQILIGWAALGAAAFLGTLSAPAAPPEPVEALRDDLPFQLGEDRNPAALDHRRETLKKRVAALKTIGELRRALALTEWKDTPGNPATIRAIDQEARTLVGKRFQASVEAVAAKGDPVSRLAVARMLAEMGTGVRALNGDDTSGFGRALAPLLVRLTRDPDPAVRAAAALALGKVYPAPADAAPALKRLLETDGTAQRRAAAAGLMSLVQSVTQLQKKGRTQTGIEAAPKDVMDTSTAVVQVAGVGMHDRDAQVRRSSLEALLAATFAFSELVPEPYAVNYFPPEGRPTTPAERVQIRQALEQLKKEKELFAPLIGAMRKEGGNLARALSDPDPEVRINARRSLEMIGNTRQRLQRRMDSVPLMTTEVNAGAPPVVPVAAQQKGEAPKDDPLDQALRPGLQVIARGLTDRDARVRLASVDFLEMLEDGAAPAVPALAGALGDCDRFVRWAVARTLGKIGPVRVDLTVPGLARLLADGDTDVSKEAALTLGKYGPKAKAAVPALVTATGAGDPDMRIAAIKTLALVGPQNAAPSVPALAAALANEDAGVRVAAAETLGKLGAVARSAVPALRRALDDEDADVRRAASDAVLAILAADLTSPTAAVRRAAAEALGRMGPAARATEDALRRAIEDEDTTVRRAVHGALDSINPPR